ncbi:MAG TPA: YoaK family protein [Leadbetterella sp.]|nr:YoaK family protein [Leadbetterella sp.]
MLRKYSNSRTIADNIKLGSLTAFSGGMVNIASLLIFFSFSSNITGHYAILAAEIVKGNTYQITVVFGWILMFFLGSFVSNQLVINFNKKSTYLAHSLPILMEIICLAIVGYYGQFFYRETLFETEILLMVMLFAMGLQNGLTASISNFTVKTTHLTGLTTDLAILVSMFTKKEFRNNEELVNRCKLLLSIMVAYVTGAIVSGYIYQALEFKVFYVVCSFLLVVLGYDFYKIKVGKLLASRRAKSKNLVYSYNELVDQAESRKIEEGVI